MVISKLDEIPIYTEFCTNINFMEERRAFIAKTVSGFELSLHSCLLYVVCLSHFQQNVSVLFALVSFPGDYGANKLTGVLENHE